LSLLDRSGNLLFEGSYDGIQHAGGSYFIVNKREKKGVVASDGKLLLPIVYDAIGDVNGDRIPLLRAMNFGMYSIATGKEIRPSYQKNIIPYNNELLIRSDGIQHAGGSYFIVNKREKKGVVASDGKLLLPIVYDAIGDVNGDRIPLLRAMNFGMYSIATGKEIRPSYQKNIIPYNNELLI